MPFVAVDENLQRSNAPTFVAQFPVSLQLLHCRVGFAYDNALLDGRAAAHGNGLSRLGAGPRAEFPKRGSLFGRGGAGGREPRASQPGSQGNALSGTGQSPAPRESPQLPKRNRWL